MSGVGQNVGAVRVALFVLAFLFFFVAALVQPEITLGVHIQLTPFGLALLTLGLLL